MTVSPTSVNLSVGPAWVPDRSNNPVPLPVPGLVRPAFGVPLVEQPPDTLSISPTELTNF